MKLCLVGNGESPNWHLSKQPINSSELIDSCDVVVRMNWCRFYHYGWTGLKTDVLLLRPASDNGHGSEIAAKYNITVPADVVQQVNKVYICRGVENLNDSLELAGGPYRTRYGWSADQVELMPNEMEARTREVSRVTADYSMITLGTIAVQWALETHPAAELYLAGYYFAGTTIQDKQATHNYVAERDWIKWLEHKKRLTILP